MIRTNEQAPKLNLPLLNGNNDQSSFDTSKLDDNGIMTIIVFYRGKHCPICIGYLADIERKYDSILQAGLRIVAVSMDDAERTSETASAVAKSLGLDDSSKLRLPLAHGLSIDEARQWGLYLSSARAGTSEPSVYSEPGLFVLNNESGKVFMASVQSAPFTRPDIEQLVGGLQFAIEHKYPTRGTYVVDSDADA